ncbi:MAG: hypothetical protein CR972_02965 [Candidatus Moraniibacteriota bacterium]|nr:MAG: hypothetical protein CR972_02965 [Candidatus Moranbacteria bacterium]
MLTVKTWCLPADLTEEQLQELHNAIVCAVTSVPETRVSSENDMLNLFPEDKMRYGLGTEILVEITGCTCSHPARMKLMQAVGKVVKSLFPQAHVTCTATSIEFFGSWSS